MIRSKENKQRRPIEIDLSGPHGNAFHLMGLVGFYGRACGYSEGKIKAIRKVMMMGDYEGAIKVFDGEFGHFVTLWR